MSYAEGLGTENMFDKDWSERFRRSLVLHGRSATKTGIHRRVRKIAECIKGKIATIGDFERPCGLPCHALHLARHCPLAEGLSGRILEGYYRQNI